VSHVTFYYDLGSPFAYLTAERLPAVLPEPVVWQPVSLGGLFKLSGRSSWAIGDPELRADGIADIEVRASRLGLPPLRWPDPWPGHYLAVMRAATWADGLGQGRAFAHAAFRHAFADGADLGLLENVRAAAQAAGLDPDAAERATQDDAIKRRLRNATERAHARGVFGVPTIAVGDELFWGDDRLEDAARCLAR